MNPTLKSKLQSLANKYEDKSFLEDDPSQFMTHYHTIADKEVAAFIAATLAFGRRDQIISHVNMILSAATPSPAEWLRSGRYKDFFPNNRNSFYRVFSNKNMRELCGVLQKILSENKTLGAYFEIQYKQAVMSCPCNSKRIQQQLPSQDEIKATSKSDNAEHCKNCKLNPFTPGSKLKCKSVPLFKIIQNAFSEVDCGNLIPKTRQSSCKRLQLFLRWIVRDDSPVDLGLWTWYDKSNLLMPLDTHVMQESVKFGLMKKSSSGKIPAATISKAYELTEQMKLVWPDDPAKGDFALFGLGVNE